MRMFGKKDEIITNVVGWNVHPVKSPELRLEPLFCEVIAEAQKDGYAVATKAQIALSAAEKKVRRKLLRDAIKRAPMDEQIRRAFAHVIDLIP